MATDKQLIQEILLGKNETFGKLFRKYQRQVYSVCQGIVKNSHDAEELVQEVFVHAYLKLDQLDEPDKFLPWLKSIAKNRSRNYLHRKKETTIPLSQVSSTATRNTPDRLILKQELIDAVIEAIESLPQKDRELIRAHIDGLSHKDISERLGISIQASRDRLYRTRKRIKARVKDLLNAIIGLPKMLPLEKIISGGITAMKLGTSTKVTVGVIGAIVAGFIGFQVVTHNKTQQKVEPNEKVAQQTSRLKSKPKTVRKNSDKSKSAIQDEQYPTEKEIEEALAWLDSFSESEKSSVSDLSESKQLAEKQDDPEEEDDEDKLKEEQFKAELKEMWARLNRNLSKYKDMWQERQRLLSIAKAKYGDAPIPWEPYGSRYTELRQAMRKLSEKIIIDAGRYAYGTGQPEAIDSEDGWIKKLLWEHGLKITSWPRD